MLDQYGPLGLFASAANDLPRPDSHLKALPALQA